ncbi:hypothetical protein MUK72_16325 (plasmid) [Halococcus dombrowskii]|jgi:hypothetical protein|uniref:Uncharacterized protein n=1 Tax=Halococcus dombrowskii TaxID=179637 RepID=A0AAV3SKC3_HALDO|nr:hypothetical protein [Halococcus dombrowskii]UOO97011.1 hypothetical protein MUK72_16325 [Halococcus dombrowskii]
MRKYPATLERVFENKLDAGAETDEDISFDRDDVDQALADLALDVRDPMEIPSAYSSTRSLPDSIKEHGYGDIALDENSVDSGETYLFIKE